MGDVRERIDHLLRLAADAGAADNEARNAALLAARLIRQNGFTLTKGKASSSGESAEVRRLKVENRELREIIESQDRELLELQEQFHALERKHREREVARKRSVLEQDEARQGSRRWSEFPQRRIVNNYDRKSCLQCGQAIEKGARCSWVVDFGLRCMECVNER